MTKKKEKKGTIDKTILKLYEPDRFFVLILTTVLLVFISWYIIYPDMIEREMLFWFFAATSQSMAALLAIIGMMAVFRYQDMQMRLRNLYDSIKGYISGGEILHYFSNQNPASWEDSTIVSRVKELIKNKPDNLPEQIENNLDVSVIVMESHERLRGDIVELAKPPVLTILITFMVSVFSILFVNIFFSQYHLNLIGLIITLFMIVLITSSILFIVKYINITLTKY